MAQTDAQEQMGNEMDKKLDEGGLSSVTRIPLAEKTKGANSAVVPIRVSSQTCHSEAEPQPCGSST